MYIYIYIYIYIHIYNYLYTLSNSIDFYKGIFLHVVSFTWGCFAWSKLAVGNDNHNQFANVRNLSQTIVETIVETRAVLITICMLCWNCYL